jgi:hypothetical protein
MYANPASMEAWQKKPDSVLSGNQVIAQEIERALKENRGSLIGRHGTIELTTILLAKQTGQIDWEKAKILERNAGVFPQNDSSIKQWIQEYSAATVYANVMAAGWYPPLAQAEMRHISTVNPKCQLVPLRSIEPYYSSQTPWTRLLSDQRVTVVSSFAVTMGKQVKHSSEIWPYSSLILPTTATYSFVRSYYSPALANGKCEWPIHICSWADAVEHLEKEVLKTNPRIVLIGCGGLAMPLAFRLKQKGIIAIVMGGAIQLLFGIKGKRWETHDVISKFFTDAWVYPESYEIPNQSKEIEGGCYW